MKIIVAARLQEFTRDGSLGVVTDTRFICCYWPRPATGVWLTPFAPGSRGIEIEGSPSPRGVIFPSNTRLLDYAPDAQTAARQAFLAAYPQRKFHSLNEEETTVFMAAYERALAELPAHASWHPTVVM